MKGYSPRGRKESDMTERLSTDPVTVISFGSKILMYVMYFFPAGGLPLLQPLYRLGYGQQCYHPLQVSPRVDPVTLLSTHPSSLYTFLTLSPRLPGLLLILQSPAWHLPSPHEATLAF